MKVIIIRDTKVNGVYTPAGKKPVEINDADARQLILLKRAVAVDKPAVTPSQGAVKSKTESNVDASPDTVGKGDKS